jgi:hypothetical protein
MKLLLLGVAAMLGLADGAIGSVICSPGTLASYEGLGPDGCTIGSTTFSGFNAPSGISLSSAIPLSNISVTPQGGTANPSLVFSFSVTALNGQILESLINYSVSGALFTSTTITAGGTTTAGNGAVTDIQNYCLGGSFDSTGVFNCSSGKAGDLVVLGFGNDSAMFTGVASVNVTNDITFDSGGAGSGNSAAGGVFTAAFTSTTAVPEPRGLGLLAGLLVGGVYMRRIFFRSQRRHIQ